MIDHTTVVFTSEEQNRYIKPQIFLVTIQTEGLMSTSMDGYGEFDEDEEGYPA